MASDLKVVFILTPNGRRPRSHIKFARAMNILGMTLIPISIDDMSMVTRYQQRSVVIVIESKVSEKRWLRGRASGLLRSALNQDKIHLIHLSSFEELEGTDKHRLSKTYHRLKIPLSFAEIALKASEVLKSIQGDKSWPGGKRSKPFWSGLDS